MIFAVNVVGDGAAQGDKARAWRDRQEKAKRNNAPHDLSQGRAGLGPKRARG